MTGPTFIQQPRAEGAPEGELVTAPLRRRTFAFLIDALVAALIAFAVMIPITPLLIEGGVLNETEGVLATITEDSTSSAVLVSAMFLGIQMLAWAIYAGLTSARTGEANGQTCGMQALRIRVVTASGGPLPRDLAWRRAAWLAAALSVASVVGAFADFLAGSAPLGSSAGDLLSTTATAVLLFTALSSPTRRSILDDRLGTAVVRADGPVPAMSIQARAVSASTWVLVALAVIVLLGSATVSLWPSLLQ
ncbi:MAG: RDD family protein [Solirubrobacteraceae bacterium]|nr:RDD family protein [Solirubrobacteraceae bacterium]